MEKNNVIKIIGIVIVAALVMPVFSAYGISEQRNEQSIISKTNASKPYEGHLRVYIAEPVSRWNMYNQQPYHFGFLDFAFDEDLSINYLDTSKTQPHGTEM